MLADGSDAPRRYRPARRHRERVSLVPVDDSRLDLDVDTGEDYEEVLRIQGRPAERVAGDL